MHDAPKYKVELSSRERWCVVNPKGVTLLTNMTAQDAENIAWLMNMADGERTARLQRENMGS